MISSQIKTTQGTEERSNLRRAKLGHAKKIVVKLGTSLVVNPDGGFNHELIRGLASQIQDMAEEGKQFILVTSGAVGLGNKLLGFEKNGNKSLIQCAASLGQSLLMNSYSRCFDTYGIPVSQLLLTNCDTAGEKSEATKHMIEKQLDMGIVVIVNENDAVSTDALSFGDNDFLSAHISNTVDADLLILLTDVHGLYEDIESESRIPVVEEIHEGIECCIGQATLGLGKGGMGSKLSAAKIANTITVVANGREDGVLKRILAGEDIGTIFCINGGKDG